MNFKNSGFTDEYLKKETSLNFKCRLEKITALNENKTEQAKNRTIKNTAKPLNNLWTLILILKYSGSLTAQDKMRMFRTLPLLRRIF